MSDRILIYRFSSFGDVLISIPVIMNALEAFPKLHIVFSTRNRFVRYFPQHERLRLIGVDMENDFKGLIGIYKLFKFIKSKGDYALVIDLHNVLRSQLLSILFKFQKLKIYKLHKNKRSKRDYISGKSRQILTSTMESYLKVFEEAGFGFHLNRGNYFKTATSSPLKDSGHSFHIGLAPFSKHATKSWPLERFTELIRTLDNHWDIQFYIFGAESEHSLSSILEKSNVLNMCGNLSPSDEISLIAKLDVMVSMDSANMHLADIIGTPVISIWGGTHPDIGFRPAFQSDDDIISTTVHLDCRPCSVYGKETCKLKSDPFLCLRSIHVKQITDRISWYLKKNHG